MGGLLATWLVPERKPVSETTEDSDKLGAPLVESRAGDDPSIQQKT